MGRRKVILAGGVLLWSVRTALSGRAWDFASLFVFTIAQFLLQRRWVSYE